MALQSGSSPAALLDGYGASGVDANQYEASVGSVYFACLAVVLVVALGVLLLYVCRRRRSGRL